MSCIPITFFQLKVKNAPDFEKGCQQKSVWRKNGLFSLLENFELGFGAFK